MSKDMINIDDFVREKLNGHSEKEDPAAWLKMKDLLDKEMPERAAPIMFRFTKPMAMLGAALLIGVLCVGGYKLSALRDKGIPAENKTENKTIITTNKSNNNRPAPQPYQTENQSEEQNPITTSEISGSKQENSKNSLANNSKPSQAGAKIANNKIETLPAKDFSISSQSRETASDSKSVPQKADVKSSLANKLAASSNASTPIASKESRNNSSQNISANTESHSNKPIDAQNDNAQATNVNTQKLATEKLALGSSTSTKENSTKIAPSKLHVEKAAENKLDNNKLAETQNNLANNGDNKHAEKTNTKQSLVKDSMPAITVVSKTTISKTFPKHPINKLDTVDIGKVPYLAENNLKSPTTPNNKNTKPSPSTTANIQAKVPENQLASKAPEAKSIKANNAATNNAGKQKKAIANWFNNLNLPEALADAKKDLKNADFFFGFSAGGNYSFSNNNSFQGVQFGPTGELVFNKHWSLFGAIKYFNRSGGKKTVNDNFSKEFTKTGMPDSTIGANNYFTIYSDSTNRYFNFSTLHSFELPLTVRYTINKFYALTGINMAYYLNLNVEQVDKEYNAVNPYTIATNSTKPILRESTSKLKSSDFGSRFAMGWILGAGYQINPAWQVDLRLVNPFWDNAQTSGAKNISKDFYKIPSVQISIGYQFGRVNSRPTFGPNSNNP